MNTSIWQNPLISRYTSPEMQAVFSDDAKFQTWRKLWLALAVAQKHLGLSITEDQTDEMSLHLTDIDYELAAKLEAEKRHDVLAHIHTFAAVCPKAAPIIHLGATSCFVTDNTDLILMRNALGMLIVKLARVINQFSMFAFEHKALPCLGFTHLMPAQLTTVGRRASMWIEDLLMDLYELERVRDSLKFLGSRGATGTGVSFLSLFGGDAKKVRQMNDMIANEFEFNELMTITGQTYSRKWDTLVLRALSGVGETLHKICCDLRDLQSRKEIEEPWKEKQAGSSAMPWKRNPMSEERCCSLARHLSLLSQEAAMTHMTQRFERTLDDSAGRRIYIPEAFLTADAVLILMQFLGEGLVVYPAMIRRNIDEELPFMATEEILMAMVTSGGSRQECHEWLRVHARTAADNVKLRGSRNNLLDLIREDNRFAPIHSMLPHLLDPQRFIQGIGEEVEGFLLGEVHDVTSVYEMNFDVPKTDLMV